MSRIEFRDLISLEEAKKRLRNEIDVFVSEKEIENCNGLTLAEDVYSDIDVPGFDRAAMDGYALKASETFGAEEDNPKKFEKIGEIMPGETKDIEVCEGEAVEVATGAVLPEGANAVVMIEFIDELGEEILVRDAVVPDENVMFAGSDILVGEKVLSKGTVLNTRDIGVLAAIGERKISVFSGLDVGIVSIGEELTLPSKKIQHGEIFDTNSFTLKSSLDEIGANTRFYGIVGDDKNDIKQIIKEAVSENDVVLTSGSTSAGSSDLLNNVLEKGKILFHGVSVKPGKPTIAAVFKGSLIIGLPGYPTSALTIYNLLVDPVLRETLCKEKQKKQVKAVTSTKIKSTSGRRHFHPVGLVKRRNKYFCYPIEKGSGAITSLSQAEGFLEIKKNQEYISEGERKKIWLLSEEIKLPELLFMGSHCKGIDLIRNNLNASSKSLNVGSSGGFRLMKKKIPDISGVHLLADNGDYNTPFMERFNLKEAFLIRGYLRKQGFFVEKGNPHNISCIDDLVEKPIRLINRNKGSGTRKLLDMKLKNYSEKKDRDLDEIKQMIKGYNTNSRTHSGVAAAIKVGKADVGVGVEYFAREKDLDFLEINEEQYDFLINKGSENKKIINEFISYIRSSEFKNELNNLTGLKTYRETGQRIKHS